MEMALTDRIVIDPGIIAGKPIIKGTRIAVEFLVDLLGQGWSIQQILDNYPGIQPEDVKACLTYAAKVLRDEQIFPIAS
jgi:uncharacterized protein (DUF433 family)